MPLAIATGAGAEMREAIGTAVFSGMLGETLFGPFFTPVFCVVIRAIAARGGRTGKKDEGAPALAEGTRGTH